MRVARITHTVADLIRRPRRPLIADAQGVGALGISDPSITRRSTSNSLYVSPATRRRPRGRGLVAVTRGLEHLYADGTRFVVITRRLPVDHAEMQRWLVDNAVRRLRAPKDGDNCGPAEFERAVAARTDELLACEWTSIAVTIAGVPQAIERLMVGENTFVACTSLPGLAVAMVCHGSWPDPLNLAWREESGRGLGSRSPGL